MKNENWYKESGIEKWKYVTTKSITYFLPEGLFLTSIPKEEYYQIRSSSVTISKEYAWDGVTSPKAFKWLLDRPSFRRAALVHDVLLQAIYDDEVLPVRYLDEAHKIFKSVLLEDTNWFSARVMYYGLIAGHKIWHKYKG